MRSRQTLKRELCFSGVGLHSGKPAEVRVRPAQEGGIRLKTATASHCLRAASLVEANRMTALQLPDGTQLQTVEHLLSALLSLGVDDAEICLDGVEMPILDGSALPFVTAIHDCGLQKNGSSVSNLYLCAPIGVSLGEKSIVALPSSTLRVSYTIHYPGSALGSQFASLEITPESYSKRVAPARTFCLEQEIAALHAAGLALGGSLENALVIGKHSVLNPEGFRLDGECVAHKILDFLGDLALVGRHIVAHYIINCGGHTLHAQLVQRLRALFSQQVVGE